MLITRPMIVDGAEWGTIITLTAKGDVFDTHTHTVENNHITAVIFGSIRLTGHPKYEGRVVHAKAGGTIINWTAGEPHGWIAETDGATAMNLPKARP